MSRSMSPFGWLPALRRFDACSTGRAREEETTRCHHPGQLHPKGLSLLELAMVMVILSLALVPVVQMLGGTRSQSGEGSVDRITGMKSKEAVLANSLVEQILAGDFSRFNCNSGGDPVAFDPDTELPDNGDSKNFTLCTDRTYSSPLYYRWSVTNVSGMPKQNEYFQAIFNIYDKAVGGRPILTMPAYFFRNDGSYNTEEEKFGLMMAMDVSGSMASGSGGYVGQVSSNMASPYMFYRYDRNRFNGTAWGVTFSPGSVPGMSPGTKRAWLNMWNNNELDMSYGQSISSFGAPDFSDPVSDTDNNEKFPYADSSINDGTWGNGILGSGDCSTNNVTTWNNDTNLTHAFIPAARSNSTLRNYIRNLCRKKTSTADWSNALDQNMSRLEAARTGAISLMLNLEQNPTMVNNLEMGYIPWSDSPKTQHLVKMEAPSTIPGVSGLHFQNIRNKLLWINRADPQQVNSTLPVIVGGGTAMQKGLEAAWKEVMSKTYDRRIIVLLTDGEPTDMSKPALTAWVNNTFGNNAPRSQQATLFTVGLIGADPALMNSLANSTPDGQAFVTNDLAQLKNIFESISYQVQKLSLLSTGKRYDIEF